MRDREIRLELAKAALIGGASLDTAKMMLEWVMDDSGIDLDKVSVAELEPYLGMSAVRFRNRCMENEIHTVGQLVRVGSSAFRSLRLVGVGLCDKVAGILNDKYGVTGW